MFQPPEADLDEGDGDNDGLGPDSDTESDDGTGIIGPHRVKTYAEKTSPSRDWVPNFI